MKERLTDRKITKATRDPLPTHVAIFVGWLGLMSITFIAVSFWPGLGGPAVRSLSAATGLAAGAFALALGERRPWLFISLTVWAVLYLIALPVVWIALDPGDWVIPVTTGVLVVLFALVVVRTRNTRVGQSK